MRRARILLRTLLGLFLIVTLPVVAFGLTTTLRETETRHPDEGRMVETPMGAFYVREAGDAGEPVLLIHGALGWSGIWDPTLQVLAAAGFRVVTPDIPPMGWSQRDADGDYDSATQAARIRALVRALGVRPHLVAHSFGAEAALEAAFADPGAFTSLTLVGGPSNMLHPPEVMSAALRFEPAALVGTAITITNPLLTEHGLRMLTYRTEAVTPELAARMNAPFRREGTTPAIARWLPTMLGPRDPVSAWNGRLGALRLPTTILWGAADPVAAPSQGERLAEAIPGATFEPLAEVGHLPQYEDPNAFHRALILALNRMSPV